MIIIGGCNVLVQNLLMNKRDDKIHLRFGEMDLVPNYSYVLSMYTFYLYYLFHSIMIKLVANHYLLLIFLIFLIKIIQVNNNNNNKRGTLDHREDNRKM